jgi:chemotaxis protein histidine kinase CheA
MSMDFDEKMFIESFVEEAREHVERITSGVLGLERGEADDDVLNQVARSLHNIKGAARMVKLLTVGDLAHKVEDVFLAFRSGALTASGPVFNVLLGGMDLISEYIEAAMEQGDVPLDEARPAYQSLMEARDGRLAAAGGAPAQAHAAPAAASAAPKAPQPPKPAPAAPKPKSYETIRVDATRLDQLIKLAGEMLSTNHRMRHTMGGLKQLRADLSGLHETLSGRGDGSSPADAAEAVLAGLKALDKRLSDDGGLMDLLMNEMQERTLLMRMLPLSVVFDTFHRAVRDMTSAMGKEVAFEVSGAETELDKKIIENIGDPLVHMIRNSIDHGIETPGEREAAGKPRAGRLTLSASHDGDCVVIRLEDDGRGISASKVRARAISKGLMEREAIEVMSDEQVRRLIFHHGFSTSEIITDLSGRGVGMEVVKQCVEDTLKGSVELHSVEGQGTCISLRLPLTLAIMRVLLFRSTGMTFAVPAGAVDEVMRVPRERVIDVVDRRAIRLRGQLVPVAELDALLGLPEVRQKTEAEFLLMIVRVGAERLGLVIDELVDEENMVIKPLPTHMRAIPQVSGVAISGSNEVVNVLNTNVMIQAAKEGASGPSLRLAEPEDEEKRRILVVDDSVNTREIERAVLESYGYAVTLASDGMEALEMALVHEEGFHLVVTDVEMPRMDGFSLTERLRSDDRYATVPIVIVTSRDKEADKRRGIEAGADAYILKGAFDQSRLYETVRSLIG